MQSPLPFSIKAITNSHTHINKYMYVNFIKYRRLMQTLQTAFAKNIIKVLGK